MANRHKSSGGRTVYSGAGSSVAKAAMRADGGRVYTGAGSNVAKEAESNSNMKRGGKAPGGKGKRRFASGGCVSSPMSSAGGGKATKNPFAV